MDESKNHQHRVFLFIAPMPITFIGIVLSLSLPILVFHLLELGYV